MGNIEFKAYMSRLSSGQKAWSAAALVGAALIVALGMFYEPAQERPSEHGFAPEMSIKQIAPKLGVTGRALARELDLPLEVPKKKPLGKLGISQE